MSEKPIPQANLSERDFYAQACEYFRYHAGQRTTMINYYIVVLGACLTLYGSFIASAPIASGLIAVFMLIVSVLFYHMDLRTKFDVKQSQNVICEFEQRYGVDKIHRKYALGVFSNEDLIFALYDDEFHNNPTFCALRAQLLQLQLHPSDTLQTEFDAAFDAFAAEHPQYNKDVLKGSLTAKKIPHLSDSIRQLFFICMAASVVGILAALAVFIFSLQ